MSCQLTTIGLLPKEVDRVFNEWAKSTGTVAGGLKGLHGLTSNLGFSMSRLAHIFRSRNRRITNGSLRRGGSLPPDHPPLPLPDPPPWRSDGLDQLEQEPPREPKLL